VGGNELIWESPKTVGRGGAVLRGEGRAARAGSSALGGGTLILTFQRGHPAGSSAGGKNISLWFREGFVWGGGGYFVSLRNVEKPEKSETKKGSVLAKITRRERGPPQFLRQNRIAESSKTPRPRFIDDKIK